MLRPLAMPILIWFMVWRQDIFLLGSSIIATRCSVLFTIKLFQHYSSNDPSSVVRCWSRRFESKIKADILRLGWRNWVFSSCSPWGANFSLLWHYSEVGWLERSSHQQPTICTTFQEWPKSLSKIIFHANFVEKFVCQKVELLCVSNSLMSTRVPYFA